MEKQKKWQFFLILSVIALTIYNILPTVFYYSKPLKSPINEKQAANIAKSAAERVNKLESDAKDWLTSYCNLLNMSPKSITSDGQNLTATFTKTSEASTFRKFMPRAGSFIPFIPAQLGLGAQEKSAKDVLIQRRIPIQLEQDFFSFAPKNSPEYKEVILDRAAQVALSLAGPTDSARALSTLDQRYLESLAFQINSIAELSTINKSVANRYAAGFTQGQFSNRSTAIQSLINAFDNIRDSIKKDPKLAGKEKPFINAEIFLKKHKALFSQGQEPLTLSKIKAQLTDQNTLSFGNLNPLFSTLTIDWENSQILLKLHPDVDPKNLEQPLINEIAKVSNTSNEVVSVHDNTYLLKLHTLPETSGLLVLDLEKIVKKQADQILSLIEKKWEPKHQDLLNLKVTDSTTAQTLTPEQKALSLVINTPNESNPSFYIATSGIGPIIQSYEQFPNSDPALTFHSDFRKLSELLLQNGFQPYRGQNGEIVFEKNDYIQSLLAATREDFTIKGTKKYATLELSNLEQRLLVENRIDTSIHDDLIKWKDDFNAAQVSINPGARLDVPKPTKSTFLSNLALSWTKFFRGDEKRVIRWGLDLSGGKTVQIELRDANNQVVTNEADLKQGINELYNRVNKMGVSEVAIRQLGNHIVLDFPGSQSLSASELIKASSMYFHVVNEKFSSRSSPLASLTNQFLQEVWNEAVVTHRTDSQSINAIAWKHLHGETITEAARELLDKGLLLQSPNDPSMSTATEDTVSKVALIRGDKWFGQTHPLLLVFRNFALEGSQLDHIQSNYDPQKGNFLSFEVRNSTFDRAGQQISPRETLQTWTSRYSKEKVIGTPLEDYSNGHGWRMAVLLNDTVISAPTLDAVIRDSASISGSFSQREVSQLAADLKAGSLTFTPHILSEKNVSPELGQKERSQGILATIVALALVIVCMITYYRFAGLIASVAVLFNLLILWATLQNLGATLSLAGIAGIILTVGMAVDANVLVFERVKEEFAITGRISSAISAGYKKAYSAIIDSNVTTIIAALILLNFDAGPIKGFAITLIIGIVSSMFTALFMTRFYFNGWLQNPKNKALNMANWIHAKSIDFLKFAKLAFAIAATIIIAGSYLVYAQRANIFGMDFTGGFSLHLEVEPREDKNYIQTVEHALISQGAAIQDFQIRELNPSNHLRILFGTSMEQPGKPFFNMPVETKKTNPSFKYETNPRIDWVVQTLKSNDLVLTQSSLADLEKSWTAMSGQMSDSMRNNALIGLLISFICIFIYITVRFEYKFAAAAIICLLHDVLVTIGLMGVLYALGVPVQIDLNTVAAIMTIVGYSLNDTIIIFDRIREEMRTTRNKPLPFIVNSALNATLSRTVITSGTTLLVLIALVGLGGASIFSFALVMTIGVLFGTLSSWYIASPLMLFFHSREERGLAKQS
ncbi:MAG: protein translocase subunit SecDF [Chlamydiae bacterium CG10_big_fil_rev_8_21_14_0_10_42_34]|nr:MAG: protein translocase subunit SecDF [Chlamydiae bacterium CG10_big_fil_rev_8_21_14_0_10_42_34]